ncbi:zinc-binding dehydrogenase [Streptomyces sp. NBC_00669]|uniref:zinc-binding dehydrogenase n=1 Tax=unclassified Streptomyces TaxID=2593676 RepID=UPI002E376596|nr:zinc-binding dehydrogenase [Streptomyces sp. NBC_00669]
MKAAVIDKVGAAPHATSLDDPSPATETQVVVQVEATALNSIDLHVAEGHHRAGPPKVPYVPGFEVVGTIVAGPDQGLRVHATVPAGLAPGVNGGLAELLVTERAACIPVPDGLDSVPAAAIGAVGAGADLSLRKADLQAGESVLVLGATGPFGASFVQLAKLAGAKRVIAAGRNPERLAQVRDADGVVVLGDQPLSEQLAALGGPVDLVVDPLWGPWGVPALACLQPGGRYLNVGAAAGDETAFRVEMLRSAQLTLIGFSGTTAKPADAFAAYNRVAALAAAGSFELPTATYPLAEATQAWEAQASSPGKKIVVVP